MVGATTSRTALQRQIRLLRHVKMKRRWHVVHEVEVRGLAGKRVVLSPSLHAKRHEDIGRYRVLKLTWREALGVVLALKLLGHIACHVV